MKKSKKQFYRVECNFGSKYFENFDKALAFFEYKSGESLEIELWRITYIYCPRKKIYSATQELLGYSDKTLSKF